MEPDGSLQVVGVRIELNSRTPCWCPRIVQCCVWGNTPPHTHWNWIHDLEDWVTYGKSTCSYICFLVPLTKLVYIFGKQDSIYFITLSPVSFGKARTKINFVLKGNFKHCLKAWDLSSIIMVMGFLWLAVAFSRDKFFQSIKCVPCHLLFKKVLWDRSDFLH